MKRLVPLITLLVAVTANAQVPDSHVTKYLSRALGEKTLQGVRANKILSKDLRGELAKALGPTQQKRLVGEHQKWNNAGRRGVAPVISILFEVEVYKALLEHLGSGKEMGGFRYDFCEVLRGGLGGGSEVMIIVIEGISRYVPRPCMGEVRPS